jgi:hypothetical protein
MLAKKGSVIRKSGNSCYPIIADVGGVIIFPPAEFKYGA